MAMKTANDETQKVTITLPRLVLQRMDELIPARQRSRFIAEALAERLALAEQLVALEESAGAWSDEGHPEMADDEAIDRWLAGLRASWTVPVAEKARLLDGKKRTARPSRGKTSRSFCR